MGLRPIDDVLQDVGMDLDEFEAVRGTRLFNDALQEEAAHWQSSPNTAERIRHKYLANIELAAENLFGELVSDARPLNHRAELLKVMARLAGLDAPKADGGAARVKITINMGAERVVNAEGGAVLIDHDAEDAYAMPVVEDDA